MNSGVGITFGGPDRGSIRAASLFPNGLFISPLIENNADPKIHHHLYERHFVNGSALFGRESPEEMADFRAVAGLDDIGDTATVEIIQYYVQRIRNYRDIVRIVYELEIDEAFTDAGDDACDQVESRVSLTQALKKLQWMSCLPQWSYERFCFGRNLGFPPFEIRCRCLLEAIIPGVDY